MGNWHHGYWRTNGTILNFKMKEGYWWQNSLASTFKGQQLTSWKVEWFFKWSILQKLELSWPCRAVLNGGKGAAPSQPSSDRQWSQAAALERPLPGATGESQGGTRSMSLRGGIPHTRGWFRPPWKWSLSQASQSLPHVYIGNFCCIIFLFKYF